MAVADYPSPTTSIARDDGPAVDALGMAPYHASAGAVVNAGALCMLVFALLGIPLPWLGFFVGAIPTFLLLARVHAASDAR